MKDSFYFPHDFHARHDPKLERLRMEIGPVGDGIYWNIVEMLYEQGGHLPLSDIPLIAKTLNTSPELINKVVMRSGLMSINHTKFYSKSLLVRLKHINAKRRKARASAILSHSANAERTRSERSARKESKVKESKVKKEKKEELSDEAFFLSLKTQERFKHINIDNELLKVDSWLLAHPGRTKTRKFVLGWLSRIEPPLRASNKKIQTNTLPDIKKWESEQSGPTKEVKELIDGIIKNKAVV